MTHALNHYLRVEAVAIFHEGEFTAGEVAEMTGADVKAVTGHIHDLYESGCIEFAGHKEVDGVMRPVYRALVLPEVTPEVYREMPMEDRHELNGAVTQGILTEAVSAYGRGKMDEDEDLYLVWDAPYLDAEGEREMHDFMAACYKKGAKKIHAKAANRMAKSGEKGRTRVIAFLSFRRGRSGRPEGGYFNSANDER